MCRLFGFRSNVPARVHRALVHEANSLRVQSREHKDGWGIASYADGLFPQVARGCGPAHSDPEFERVSSLVSSHAVIAHVRLASVGAVNVENAHPFAYRCWTFAHNGTLQRFADHRAELEALIDPDFREQIVGETDSERCFYLFLTQLRRQSTLEKPPLDEVARALVLTARLAVRITEVGATKPSSTNFLVTDGRLLVATRRYRTLFFTARRSDAVHTHCTPDDGERVGQILIASEKLDVETTQWCEVPEDAAIGVDHDLTFRSWSFDQLAPMV